MKLSAYAIAIGVEQRRYPWEAAVLSALQVADEFCLAYDARFDDPSKLQLDSRVNLQCINIDFSQWDFINKALTEARRACQGDWCLLSEMDLILNEPITGNVRASIARAEKAGHEAIKVRWVSPIQNLIDAEGFGIGSYRQSITRNEPWLYHKTSDYMIDHIDSPIWDGKCLKNSYDDFSYFDERSNAWFNAEDAEFVELDYSDDIGEALSNYTHLWHYSFYNPGRKNAQGEQTRPWQTRVYGHSAEFDIEKQIWLLRQRIIIDPVGTKNSIDYFSSNGYVPFNFQHPEIVKTWVESMYMEAI